MLQGASYAESPWVLIKNPETDKSLLWRGARIWDLLLVSFACHPPRSCKPGVIAYGFDVSCQEGIKKRGGGGHSVAE